MAYDVDAKGIQINITPKSGGLSTHWFFDWKNKSFWPVLLPVTQQAYSCMYYSEENEVLLGCKDGYIRNFDYGSATDDGTAISSYGFYGPIRIAGNELDSGTILELKADIALGSGNVNWELMVGESYESCLKSTAFMVGSWSIEGVNPSVNPHAGGGCYGIKVSNGESLPWAIEGISGVLEITGKQRIL